MLKPTAYLSISRSWAGAVHIPLDELERRTHELPPPHRETLLICDSLDSYFALGWLHARGRRARLVSAADINLVGGDADATRARYRLWEPNEWLEEMISVLVPSHPSREGSLAALDLGCGSGREAVYLADLGFQVVAVDRLPEALKRGRDLQRRYAPDSPPIQWIGADLEKSDWHPDGVFDLITLFYFYSRTVIQRAWGWLKPGGSLLIEAFTSEHRARFGKPASDLRAAQRGELQRLIPPTMHVVDYSEGWRSNGRHTVRLWATRA